MQHTGTCSYSLTKCIFYFCQELASDLQREKAKMEDSIAELEDSISHLETQLKDAKEKEKLLIEYPDLNGPVNSDFAGMYM